MFLTDKPDTYPTKHGHYAGIDVEAVRIQRTNQLQCRRETRWGVNRLPHRHAVLAENALIFSVRGGHACSAE